MTFTATNYLYKGVTYTATTTATGSATTSTARQSVIAMTISNTATTNLTTYADVGTYDGTNLTVLMTKAPLYPGGALVVEGIQKHILPTGGEVRITPYSTFVASIYSAVEVT